MLCDNRHLYETPYFTSEVGLGGKVTASFDKRAFDTL
jgi:hypothetical protein